jgi:hypothetical protein
VNAVGLWVDDIEACVTHLKSQVISARLNLLILSTHSPANAMPSQLKWGDPVLNSICQNMCCMYLVCTCVYFLRERDLLAVFALVLRATRSPSFTPRYLIPTPCWQFLQVRDTCAVLVAFLTVDLSGILLGFMKEKSHEANSDPLCLPFPNTVIRATASFLWEARECFLSSCRLPRT